MEFQATHPALQSSHAMISTHHAVINGGDFRQCINIHNTEPPINILMKYVATSAFHNSTNHIDGEEAPRLHPKTRVAVRERVRAWLRRTDNETTSEPRKSARWITGAAGVGKTAIVQSLAEELHQMTTLSASFFFKRSDPARNHAHFLIATWAYQIFQNSPPEIQQAILRAIESHPLIFECDIFTQFQTVIANPLRGIIDAAYLQRCDTLPVLIIDGLDECIAPAMQSKILGLVFNAIQHWETPFLFLIASRPEVQILDILGNDPGCKYCVCVDLNLDPRAEEDIKLYLLDELRKCANTHPLRRYLPAGWPPQRSINTLVYKSSGNFIYASTAVKYVTSLKHQPHRRLEDTIHITSQSHTAFADLDALYTHILKSAEATYPPQKILALCCKFHTTVSQIEGWLSLPQGAVAEALSDMGSLAVIDVYRSNWTINILHASFGDYIFNASRAGDMYVDKRQLLKEVAMGMIKSFMKESGPHSYTYLWWCLRDIEIDAQMVEFISTNIKIADNFTELQKDDVHRALSSIENIPEICHLMDSSESQHAHRLSSYLRSQFHLTLSAHICAPPWTRDRMFQAATVVITTHRSLAKLLCGRYSYISVDDGIFRDMASNPRYRESASSALHCQYFQELRRFFINKLATGTETFNPPTLFAEASYFCLDKLCSGPKSYAKYRLPVLSHFLQRTRRYYPRKWRRKSLFIHIGSGRLTPSTVFPRKGARLFRRNRYYPYGSGPGCTDHRPSQYSAIILAEIWSRRFPWEVLGFLRCRNRLREYADCLQLLPKFLRRAGRSDDLIKLCRTCAFTAQSQDFPRLLWRARAAIWEYLMKWCGPEGVNGARE